MPNTAPGLSILEVTQFSERLYQACQRLVPQLTHNNPPPSRQELRLLISSPSAILLQALHSDFEEEIIGLVTLILYRAPTGLRAYSEDLVVDEKARGRHIGEALMHACVERAAREGASQVMLTCNPARLAANRLYKRMGFTVHKTNVYRYVINKDNVTKEFSPSRKKDIS